MVKTYRDGPVERTKRVVSAGALAKVITTSVPCGVSGRISTVFQRGDDR